MQTINKSQSANKPTQPATATVKAEPDPASALGDLRARALQSKSRRPKHPHTTHIPPPLTQRTQPPADLILDYTGDGLGVQPHLEEGEIGDMHTGSSAASQSAPSAAEIPGLGRQKSLTPSLHKRPPTIKQESPPHSARLYRPIQQDVDMENPGRTNTIDEFHVRPGLALSQSQYDACKDIVLDLLGWGVTPEYLAQCGLSREIIFFTFTELNLRLPANLDTTGLSPFDPTAPREPSHTSSQPPAAPDLAAIEREMKLAVQMRKKKNQPPSPPVPISTQSLSPGGGFEAEEPSNDADAFLNSIVPPTHEPIEVDETIRRPSEPPTSMAPPPATPPEIVRPASTSTAGPSQPRPELYNRRRPTAADYVDESHKDKSGSNLVRKKISSFAGIKRPAKMVIDLSDTESEEDDDPMDGSAAAASSSSKSATPRLTESKSLLDVESSLAKAKEELQLRILSRQSRRPTIENPVPVVVKSPQDMVTPSPNSATASPPAPDSDAVTQPPPTSPGVPMDLAPGPSKHAPASTSVPTQQSEEAVVDPEASASAEWLVTREIGERSGKNERFTPYESVLDSYPLLRCQPFVRRSFWSSSAASVSNSSSTSYMHANPQVATPDLEPFKMAYLFRNLNSQKFLCHYEIPGGGICRDTQCDNIHPSRLTFADCGISPTDEEAAAFLSSSLGFDIDRLTDALRQVQTNTSILFEERVGRALQFYTQPA